MLLEHFGRLHYSHKRIIKEEKKENWVIPLSPLNHFIILQVEVLVPPAVQPMPGDGTVTARKGADLTLRCSGRGNPNPRITWRKAVRILIMEHIRAVDCLDLHPRR